MKAQKTVEVQEKKLEAPQVQNNKDAVKCKRVSFNMDAVLVKEMTESEYDEEDVLENESGEGAHCEDFLADDDVTPTGEFSDERLSKKITAQEAAQVIQKAWRKHKQTARLKRALNHYLKDFKMDHFSHKFWFTMFWMKRFAHLGLPDDVKDLLEESHCTLEGLARTWKLLQKLPKQNFDIAMSQMPPWYRPALHGYLLFLRSTHVETNLCPTAGFIRNFCAPGPGPL